MRLLVCVVLAATTCLLVQPAVATDVDGPNDCVHQIHDFGDAPEFVPAYPAVPGRFPTCIAPGPVGTQTFVCPPISTPPGPTGYVHHIQFGMPSNYWLGCYFNAIGPYGIDNEIDGKTNTPAVGISACGGIPTDCIEAAFGMTFDQDECFGDGSDAGVRRPTLIACRPSAVTMDVFNCGQPRQVFLNICLDLNRDGDWNDNVACPGACAYEWAVVNAPFTLPAAGCLTLTSPLFLVGPQAGPSWMRVSISDDPMPLDYPWNGTVSLPGSATHGGETEDYPVFIDEHIGTAPSTWGNMKTLYR